LNGLAPVVSTTDNPHAFNVRIAGSGESVRAYCRNHTIVVGSQASLREADAHPSAVEHMLAALGGDLLTGLAIRAARRGLVIHAAELSLAGRLNNILVHLGVVGEYGHPGFDAIDGTVFVSADCEEQQLAELWQETLSRAPVFHTLSRAVTVRIDVRLVP